MEISGEMIVNKENKYYVYGHYYKENNQLFYIGKGTRDRSKTTANRSNNWKLAVQNKQWYSVILFSGLSFKNAIIKESELIDLLKDKLINTLIKTNKNTNLELIQSSFYYDESSITGLRWAIWNGAHNPATSRNAGDPAGNIKFRAGNKTSIEVTLKGQQLQVHRVIWYLINGVYPDIDSVIDHIDGNPHNNLISNLRLVSYHLNSKNRSKQSNNRTGIVGVSKMNNGYGKDYTVAKVVVNGKAKQKYFDDIKLGEQEAFRLACEWRKEQIRLLNEQGAGYTDRHGTLKDN